MKTDIDIAREAEITAIGSIASKLGIGEEYLEQYGKFKAKVKTEFEVKVKVKEDKDKVKVKDKV